MFQELFDAYKTFVGVAAVMEHVFTRYLVILRYIFRVINIQIANINHPYTQVKIPQVHIVLC